MNVMASLGAAFEDSWESSTDAKYSHKSAKWSEVAGVCHMDLGSGPLAISLLPGPIQSAALTIALNNLEQSFLSSHLTCC